MQYRMRRRTPTGDTEETFGTRDQWMDRLSDFGVAMRSWLVPNDFGAIGYPENEPREVIEWWTEDEDR